MPPARRSTTGEAPASPSTALATQSADQSALAALAALSPEARLELLRDQRAQIAGTRRLPAIKVMPAAVGLFEFSDTNETARTFEAVILHSHMRNAMWDKPFGEGTTPEGDTEGPACGSEDGVMGAPREGFVHLSLGREARAGDLVPCGPCRYNKFGSTSLFPDKPGSGKGKACTNQRSIYVLVEDRAAPMELVISPTSIRALEDYLSTLLNHGIPVLAVRTKFAQVRQERGALKWCVLTFERGEALTGEELEHAMSIRSEYHATMHPETQPRGGADEGGADAAPASGDLAAPASGDNGDVPW